ncbi:expressed unknown protein [Seminavis robusta]|uniref:Sulfotransferase domain-containing protein n=1 Tax=Seminavis robusta TaxID=568900 RepID=A0A9N8EER2_9STRA|nr:expressed unknown protein [Seminavis robusta]|eukprot:Sro1017_g231710.1 n/a (663) ;mRNA; f:7092-9250
MKKLRAASIRNLPSSATFVVLASIAALEAFRTTIPEITDLPSHNGIRRMMALEDNRFPTRPGLSDSMSVDHVPSNRNEIVFSRQPAQLQQQPMPTAEKVAHASVLQKERGVEAVPRASGDTSADFPSNKSSQATSKEEDHPTAPAEVEPMQIPPGKIERGDHTNLANKNAASEDGLSVHDVSTVKKPNSSTESGQDQDHTALIMPDALNESSNPTQDLPMAASSLSSKNPQSSPNSSKHLPASLDRKFEKPSNLLAESSLNDSVPNARINSKGAIPSVSSRNEKPLNKNRAKEEMEANSEAGEHFVPQLVATESTSITENATTVLRSQFLGADAERKIVLVHVGKAGGMSIRANLAANCKAREFKGTKTEQRIELDKCLNHYKPHQKLSGQTRDIFHVWDLNQTAMDEATSLVVTLRNPVDRIISAYRYSHPDNCMMYSKRTNVRLPATAGCHLINRGDMASPDKLGYKIFKQCFPFAGMEDFAQSLLPPWHPNDQFEKLTHAERVQCRKYAKEAVEGRPMKRVIPHMQWNYDYYAKKSWNKYPEKEVWGVRTENEWNDLAKIDTMIGGSGKFRLHGNTQTHGSEHYVPSPLSQEAYEKLCCVLENEIDIYLQVLDLSLNLDQEGKRQSEQKVRKKCGIRTPWSEWRATCKKRLEVDYEASD